MAFGSLFSRQRSLTWLTHAATHGEQGSQAPQVRM